MTLTNEEYNLLVDIASHTKMDCWFDLRQDRRGNDYVYDMEQRKKISLRSGVRLLLEGIDEQFDSYLNCDGYKVMTGLLAKLL